MCRSPIIFIFGFLWLSISCQKDSPCIPESYWLLPQSDIPIYSVMWHNCSIPIASGKTLQQKMAMIWYNPYEQVYINDIWQTIELSRDVPLRVHALTFRGEPIHLSGESWNGAMMHLSEDIQAVLDSSRYFDVTIKGNIGQIHFDIGEISEDIIPNGKLDIEDRLRSGIRNGILDPDEDIGLDLMSGSDPSDWWDINSNGIRDNDEPVSYDDWYYSSSEWSNYEKINGTEGNGRLDTEDLNDSESLDLKDDYFEYSLNLDKSSIDTLLIERSLPTNEKNGWFTYQINLNNPTKIIGNRTQLKPKFLRIWVDGFAQKAEISIVVIDFK